MVVSGLYFLFSQVFFPVGHHHDWTGAGPSHSVFGFWRRAPKLPKCGRPKDAVRFGAVLAPPPEAAAVFGNRLLPPAPVEACFVGWASKYASGDTNRTLR